jgi:hypothetical protein
MARPPRADDARSRGRSINTVPSDSAAGINILMIGLDCNWSPEKPRTDAMMLAPVVNQQNAGCSPSATYGDLLARIGRIHGLSFGEHELPGKSQLL